MIVYAEIKNNPNIFVETDESLTLLYDKIYEINYIVKPAIITNENLKYIIYNAIKNMT